MSIYMFHNTRLPNNEDNDKSSGDDTAPCELYGSEYCQQCCGVNVPVKRCINAIQKEKFDGASPH